MQDAPARIQQSLDLAARSRRLFPRRGGPTGQALEPRVLQVLLALSLDPRASTRELAGQLELSQSTISLAVKQLVEADLLAQQVAAGNANRRERSVTAAGQRQVDAFLVRYEADSDD